MVNRTAARRMERSKRSRPSDTKIKRSSWFAPPKEDPQFIVKTDKGAKAAHKPDRAEEGMSGGAARRRLPHPYD